MIFKSGHLSFRQNIYKIFMNLKITHKLIIIYIFVILLPTASLTMAIYHLNYQSIQQTYLENEKNVIKDAKDNLSIQLNQISAMSYYFQQSNTLQSFLEGNYQNVSTTLYHYLQDVNPLIKATKTNQFIVATSFYAFKDFHLYMTNGFSSVKYLNQDDTFLFQLKQSKNGLWLINYNDVNTPVLTYYKYLYTNKYPYNLGIVEFTVDFSALLLSFSEQTNASFYIVNEKDNSLILFENKTFEVYPLKLEELQKNSLYYNTITLEDIPLTLVVLINPMSNINKNITFLTLALVILLIIFTSLYFLFSTSFSGRLSSFNKHILNTEAHELTAFNCPDYKDEVGNTICSYNKLVNRINQLVHENYMVQLQSKDAEFYALQAQISPHFLYNILENIRMSAEKHKDFETSGLIHLLGNFMHYNLNPSVTEVSLMEEMRSAKNYLEIHKIRMSNQLTFDIGAFTDIDDVFIPRFILQPLLENSLKHGLQNSEPLLISVSVHDTTEHPGFVTIKIVDNGIGIPSYNLEELQDSLSRKALDSERHVGLRNVNTRLISYTGISEAGLQISSEENNGTTVSFLLQRKT